MTEHEILERGVIAASILDTPEHMAFYEDLKQFTLECIGNTEPGNTTERELLYRRYKAVEDLVAFIETYKFQAEQIIQKNEQARLEGTSDTESIFD